MTKDVRMRIGIIGAGAAGLTAAETLRDKGYANVTILEKSDRAGGKCNSIDVDGRPYELGAGIVSENNVTVRTLAKKFGVATRPVDFDTPSLFLDATTGLPLPPPSLKEKFVLLYQALFRYKRLLRRFQRITEPGLSHVDPELCMPFAEWAKKYHVERLAQEFAKYFTGFGYGFVDEVPAAYVVKYYSWGTLNAFRTRRIYAFPDGIQGLWTAVAKQHDVRYNTSITRIERKDTIVVTTETGTQEFDALIIASPLDDALQYLDATPEETALFSNIAYYDYRTYACVVKHFPKQTGYVPGNFISSRKGHPVFWYHRYADTDLYTFYVFGDWRMTDEEVRRNIERLVRQAGGTVERVHTVARWKYFPHVSPEKMRSGYFDRLESIQGENRTYYAGELLSFSTVEQTAWYAKTLVDNFF